MKQHNYLLHSLILIICLLYLCGCSINSHPTDSSWSDIEDISPEYITEYPSNEFTKLLIEPSYGNIEYVRDYSSQGKYEIVWNNITSDESNEYIKQLVKLGYKQEVANSNNSATGIILTKESTTLLIAYSDSELNVLISISTEE